MPTRSRARKSLRPSQRARANIPSRASAASGPRSSYRWRGTSESLRVRSVWPSREAARARWLYTSPFTAMHIVPDSSAMGWWPPETSTMLSRVCPSATPSSRKVPRSSGPRGSRRSSIRPRRDASVSPTMPAIPHMPEAHAAIHLRPSRIHIGRAVDDALREGDLRPTGCGSRRCFRWRGGCDLSRLGLPPCAGRCRGGRLEANGKPRAFDGSELLELGAVHPDFVSCQGRLRTQLHLAALVGYPHARACTSVRDTWKPLGHTYRASTHLRLESRGEPGGPRAG